MADSKYAKSKRNAIKQHTAAKKALSWKKKASTKFRNNELRENLDLQTQAMYNVNVPSEAQPTPYINVDATSIQDLAHSLQSL